MAPCHALSGFILRTWWLKSPLRWLFYNAILNAEENVIDMVVHYYSISFLAHEVRHPYQYIYYPELFFKTSYRNTREYLNSDIKRDADAYAKDYCKIYEYWEE